MKKTILCLLLVCAVVVGIVTGQAAFAEEPVECKSRAALMMDSGTGTVIYEKNPDEMHFRLASEIARIEKKIS